MSVKLSSKGQLVLPKHIRQELQLKPGAEFEVDVVDGKIILQPVLKQAELQQILSELRQIVHGTDLTDLMDELEVERQQEMNREQQLEQSLRSG
jgi:AbrB family transcriptional regulator (stage V sporulation protein T)